MPVLGPPVCDGACIKDKPSPSQLKSCSQHLIQTLSNEAIQSSHSQPLPLPTIHTPEQYLAFTTDNMPFTASDICKILLAIILPPVGVFLERGCGADFFINILLTILGYIPGIIHALYIILKY
ncbi:hypothetical protein LB503_001630 [Fusarium chuoi]|nr:hypothetical protein LB503_001630 [Fusarium chuoi]